MPRAALALLLLTGCATGYTNAGLSEGPIVHGSLSRVRKPHPINKGPRWTWFYFDLKGQRRQILVYSWLLLQCKGTTELEGSWVTTTGVPEPGGGPEVTERQFYARTWRCL